MDVLVIEDDTRIARLIERALVEAGYRVDVVGDGVAGLAGATQGIYHLIVLDVLLPRLDGVEVCRRLRQRGVRTPVLMLTARDAVSDRVRGLDAGADDYLVKPFALDELRARLRALQRREMHAAEEAITVGDLTLDPARREAERAGQRIELTEREWALLAYLARHAGQVLSEAEIIEQVWGYDTEATSNVVEVYIHYLRNKVDRGFARPLIRTVRGVGYTMRE